MHVPLHARSCDSRDPRFSSRTIYIMHVNSLHFHVAHVLRHACIRRTSRHARLHHARSQCTRFTSRMLWVMNVHVIHFASSTFYVMHVLQVAGSESCWQAVCRQPAQVFGWTVPRSVSAVGSSVSLLLAGFGFKTTQGCVHAHRSWVSCPSRWSREIKVRRKWGEASCERLTAEGITLQRMREGCDVESWVFSQFSVGVGGLWHMVSGLPALFVVELPCCLPHGLHRFTRFLYDRILSGLWTSPLCLSAYTRWTFALLLSAVVNRVAIRTCVWCVQFFRFLSWQPERRLEKNFQMQSISEGSECIKIEEKRWCGPCRFSRGAGGETAGCC